MAIAAAGSWANRMSASDRAPPAPVPAADPPPFRRRTTTTDAPWTWRARARSPASTPIADATWAQPAGSLPFSDDPSVHGRVVKKCAAGTASHTSAGPPCISIQRNVPLGLGSRIIYIYVAGAPPPPPATARVARGAGSQHLIMSN